MVQREIIEKIGIFVKELKKHKIRIAKVVLYGSTVSGNAHKYSNTAI